MAETPARRSPAPPARGRFQTTRWSLILAARDPGGGGEREALAELCAAYWYPLYAFLRRKGKGAEEAEDLVQGFFARLLERRDLDGVAPERGRFRSFLMAACSHYAAHQSDRERAQKRGGGRPPLSIDGPTARGRYDREPSHAMTAERLFERRWAIALLDRVLARLEEEMSARGKARAFEAFRPALLGAAERVPYAEIAEGLGLSEVAARATAQRLRRRYRALLREEVGRTVDGPADVDDEIRRLFEALRP